MDNFITITERVFSNGKYFKQNSQYNFIDRVMLKPSCPMCKPCYINSVMTHYRLEIDGQEYLIPEYAAVLSNTILSPINKDVRTRIYHEREQQPKDIRKAYKTLLGKDITDKQEADRNRIDEILKVNFSNYGNVKNRANHMPLPQPTEEYKFTSIKNDTLHKVFDITLLDEYNIERGDKLIITPIVRGNAKGIEYKWSTGETTLSIEVEPHDTTLYELEITDAGGCKYKLTTIVKVMQNLIGKQYILVAGNELPDENGNELLAAYATAKTYNPAPGWDVYLLVAPGTYELNQTLICDTSNIHIVSLTGNIDIDLLGEGIWINDNITTTIKGIRSGVEGAINFDHLAGDSVIENCILGDRVLGSTINGSVIIEGTIKNCTVNDMSIGYSSTKIVSPIIDDNIFEKNSFGYSRQGQVSIYSNGNTYNNNRSLDSENCFGFSENGSVTIYANFNNCISGNYSFGSVKNGNLQINSSIFSNCETSGGMSFGYSEKEIYVNDTEFKNIKVKSGGFSLVCLNSIDNLTASCNYVKFINIEATHNCILVNPYGTLNANYILVDNVTVDSNSIVVANEVAIVSSEIRNVYASANFNVITGAIIHANSNNIIQNINSGNNSVIYGTGLVAVNNAIIQDVNAGNYSVISSISGDIQLYEVEVINCSSLNYSSISTTGVITVNNVTVRNSLAGLKSFRSHIVKYYYCRLLAGSFYSPSGQGVVKLCIDGDNNVI